MRIATKNAAYYSTEKKILAALARVLKRFRSISLQIQTLIRETGISKACFYIHYHNLNELIDVNENKLIKDIDNAISKIKNDASREAFYRKILLTLYFHKELLTAAVNAKSIEVFEKVARQIKPFVSSCWNDYGEPLNRRLYIQFSSVFTIELYFWCEENFSIETLEKHAKNLANLSIITPKIYAPIYKNLDCKKYNKK